MKLTRGLLLKQGATKKRSSVLLGKALGEKSQFQRGKSKLDSRYISRWSRARSGISKEWAD